jgi:hypothetical protein
MSRQSKQHHSILHHSIQYFPWYGVGFLALSLFALWTSSGHLAHRTRPQAPLLDPPPLVDLSPEKIRLITLGFPRVYHHFLNIWAVQILGDKSIALQDPEEISDLMRRITLHAPDANSFYLLSCYTFLSEFDRPDLCVPLLLDGLRAMPAEWNLPLLLAVIHHINLKDESSAAVFYELASKKADAPAHLKILAAKLREKAKIEDLDYVQMLEGLSSSEQDKEQLRDYFLKKMKENIAKEAVPNATPVQEP